MNAFALLKADHEKVAGILEKIDETTERAVKGRDELFAQLKAELDLHAMIEEEILYPALEETEEAREITLEAYEEHRLVKQLLAELEAEPKDTEEWTAKLDRKSTRLNSSHSQISYAVFCLKKKKKK